MKHENLYIGTSGFSYEDWLGNFYPQFCPKLDFLQFYSSKFKVVEIDCTFYKIPTEETVLKWYKHTSSNFLFTAKFPKAVTHEPNSEIRTETAILFINRMKLLKEKLGVLLLQFPYCFTPDKINMLIELLSVLPPDIRFALELRNKCWLEVTELFDILREKNIAFCHLDHPWMPKVDIETADFSYFRFLGNRKEIENDFSYERKCCMEQLSFWKKIIEDRLQNRKDCFVFFNNHFSGHSPTTALKFDSIINSTK